MSLDRSMVTRNKMILEKAFANLSFFIEVGMKLVKSITRSTME